jgi:Ca2+-binding RTX toxin-like protein
VTGTAGDDRIEIYRIQPSSSTEQPRIFVRVNDTPEGDFNWHDVTRIRVDALGGNDLVDLHSGAGLGEFANKSAHIEGGAGKDTLIGSTGWDTLVGGSHRDVLYGNAGHDLLAGGAGNDYLVGAEGTEAHFDGNDTLGGGDGDDTLVGAGRGADKFEGGRGIDTVDYSARTDNLLIVLGSIKLPDLWPVQSGFWAQVGLEPTPGYTAQPYPDFDPRALAGTGWTEGDLIENDVENAIAGSGNDVIWGSDRDNILSGGAGNDQVYGGLGTDLLYGNDGDDRLFSADRRDAMPSIDPAVYEERIHGGAGRDYAMIDWADPNQVAKVEKIETLPFLSW